MMKGTTRWAWRIGVLAALSALGCDDYVRFGPPDGLRTEEGGDVQVCMPMEVATYDCATGVPDWPSAIFAPLFDEPTKYGCTSDNCHGLATGGGLRMVKGDSTASYDALKAYKNGTLTYIAEGDPNTAYILCNLSPDQSKLIGNQPMPVVGGDITSFVVGADLTTIAQWVKCGMPRTGTGVIMTGAGGAGGALGMGGAGGN